MPENSVFIGKGSKWANKYEGLMDVDESLYLFKRDLTALIKAGKIDLSPLKGKDLCCWCKLDKPCHGDFLLSLFPEEEE